MKLPAKMVLFTACLVGPASASAQFSKSIQEGIPSSNNTIHVSTRTGRVLTTGLHVSSASTHAGTSTFQSSVSVVGIIGSSGPVTFPSTGRAVQIYGQTGDGHLINYDYGESAYKRLYIDGTPLLINTVSGGAIQTAGTFQVGSGGTPIGIISTGTYTPTLTNTTNIDSSGVSDTFIYTRIGNIVHISGSVTINTTAAGDAQTSLEISLPIASNFSTFYQAQGVGTCTTAQRGGIVFSQPTNDRLLFQFASEGTVEREYMIIAQYAIQ